MSFRKTFKYQKGIKCIAQIYRLLIQDTNNSYVETISPMPCETIEENHCFQDRPEDKWAYQKVEWRTSIFVYTKKPIMDSEHASTNFCADCFELRGEAIPLLPFEAEVLNVYGSVSTHCLAPAIRCPNCSSKQVFNVISSI